MLTDPISDMLTRIKNAYMARKDEVVLPYSKIKAAIADILKENGYLAAVKEEGGPASPSGLPTSPRLCGTSRGAGKKKDLRLKLNYRQNQPAMQDVKRVSKPGRRIYAASKELPSVLNGYGISIISTPKGIMTNKEARKMNVGGEIICEIY